MSEVSRKEAEEIVAALRAGAFVRDLVAKVVDGFGGQVAVTPRYFLRELVDLRDLRNQDWDEQARRLVEKSNHVQVSKFQPCLPPELEQRLLIERMADVAGTRAFVARHRVVVS